MLNRGIIADVLGPQDCHHLLHHMDDAVNVAAPVTFENVFHKWRASTLWRKYAEVHVVIWSLSFELEQSVSVISLKLEGSSHRDQDVKPLWFMTSLVHHGT